MPIVRMSDLREMTREELIDKLISLKRDLFNQRVTRIATGNVENVSMESELRKAIARVLTVLRERGYIK